VRRRLIAVETASWAMPTPAPLTSRWDRARLP
jgi:hypothetical protein